MQSKSKIQTQPIEDFIGRVRTAKARQDKQINLTLKDAERLSDSLSQTMTRLVHVQDEIIDALKTAQQASTINIEMDGGDAKFWVLRRKALIQAELGDYKSAIETAKKSKAGAEAAGYDNYIKMNEESIAEWSKMMKSSGKPQREKSKM